MEEVDFLKSCAKKVILMLAGSVILAACSSGVSDREEVRLKANHGYENLDEEFSYEKSVAPSSLDKKALSQYACPSSTDLRGEAFSRSASAALQQAQKNIAVQIQSTVVSSASLKTSSVQDADGKEIEKSSYEVNSKVLTRLENAQDARQIGKVEVDGKIGVVACMSIDDAMKPFVQKFSELQDSVVLLSETYGNVEHPLKKSEIYRLGRDVYTRMVAVKNVLESFDFPVESLGDEAFSSMNQQFRQFKSRFAFYFNDGNQGEVEKALFGRISQKFNLVAGTCNGGLLLSVDLGDTKCKEGSFGITCSASLSLTGSSCFGDVYFVQKADVKGVGKYGEDEAMDRMLKMIQMGDWFNAWENELKKWNLK